MRRFLRLLLRRMDQEQSHPSRPILLGHSIRRCRTRIWRSCAKFWRKHHRPTASRSAVNQKIGDYYASCMDEKAIDAKGADPLKPELDRDRARSVRKSELADVAAVHDQPTCRCSASTRFRTFAMPRR